MFKRKKYLLLIIVFSVLFLSAENAFTQTNITELFTKYVLNDFTEKVFMHTDKNAYIAGEIIWFKIYDINATTNTLSDLSKVAYVEILDATNKPLLQSKVALKKGEGDASLYIPHTIASGNYLMRCYTNWMKNFDAAYFFEKRVSIVNLQKPPKIYTIDTIEKNDIAFFPEGGNLVYGIKSKIAFKAFNNEGMGINCNISVTENGNTIAQSSTLHKGMGSFYITPLAGNSYNVIATFENGKTITKQLPAIFNEGYVISVKDSANSVRVKIETNISTENKTFLFVHNGGTISFASENYLQNGKTVFLINKNVLKDGVSDITLFNSNRQPVCERLFFKKPANKVELNLTSEKPEYKTRDKIDLTLTTGNTLQNSDSLHLSMSVYKLDGLSANNENSIGTYLLLNSELKGIIEDPAYYFNETAETSETLDDLLLTAGWRRFKWENILSGSVPFFNYPPEYKGHIITGYVVNTQTGNHDKDVETFLSAPGSKTQFYTATSDNNGNVKYETKNFSGSHRIIVQPNLQLDTIHKIIINNPFSTTYSNTHIPVLRLSKSYASILLDENLSMQVQNIYIGNKLNNFISTAEDTTTFYYKPDARYLIDDYTRFTTIEEILREYVVFVNVTKREGNFHLPVYDVATNDHFTADPLLLLDAVPVFDLNKFMRFDPYKLKKLEVINSRYIYGASTFSGILNWQTFTGDLGDYELDPHAIVLDYEALQSQREFYAPTYETAEKLNSHLPDFRNVLQWLPNITLLPAEKKQITFYSSDVEGSYIAVIQGISSKGVCISQTTNFQVIR